MTVYLVAIVLHAVGATGLFVALGVEAASLHTVLRATTASEVRTGLGATRLNLVLGPPCVLVTLASGIYGARTWGWTWWIGTSLAMLVVVVAVGAIATGRRTEALDRQSRTSAELTLPLREPALVASFWARAALLVAILILMVTKPGFSGCLAVAGATMLVALLVVASSLRQPRPGRPQPVPPTMKP
jgi:hypothetical protein